VAAASSNPSSVLARHPSCLAKRRGTRAGRETRRYRRRAEFPSWPTARSSAGRRRSRRQSHADHGHLSMRSVCPCSSLRSKVRRREREHDDAIPTPIFSWASLRWRGAGTLPSPTPITPDTARDTARAGGGSWAALGRRRGWRRRRRLVTV
jgi:hypothetical protein